MSIELIVFVRRSRLPEANSWADTAKTYGFDLSFQGFDPAKDSGFVPCVLAGVATGFEFFLQPAEELAEGYAGLSARLKDADCAASFHTGSDLQELAASAVAAATLATMAEGTLLDPQEESVFHGSEALEYARQIVTDISSV